MKNEMVLDGYGVVELDERILKNTDGGWAWLVAIAVGIGIGAGVQIMSDWDNFKAGLSGEPEIKK
jgi:hypothetical protein